MSEVAEAVVEKKPEEVKSGLNVSSFEGREVAPKDNGATVIKLDKPIDGDIPAAVVAKPEGEETFDADEYLSKETGWKSWDEAKAAKAKLEEYEKSTPKEQGKYTPEEREKLFEDAYPILETRKKLERIEKLDATKPKDAAEIIKTDLLYKNKDLTQDDVDFMFDEKYTVPDKPKQSDEQDDDDYAKSVAKWEKQVALVEKRMAIDAKLAKPELSKLKSELVLPDIHKVEQGAQQPTQESLDAAKAARENFLRAIETDYSKLDDFSVKVKDESVEFTTAFKVPDEDKSALKKIAQEFIMEDYFGKRWVDKDGNVNVKQFMADLYLLENGGKVLQGVANNAASERRKEIIKQNSNIKLNGITSSQTNMQRPPEMERKHKEEAAIWSA
jgi:hypothetical protein